MTSILARNVLSEPLQAPSIANRVDGLVTRFIEEAADPKVLAALTVGSLSYRGARALMMGSEGLAVKLGQGLRPLAVFTGLGAEVTSFEGVQRGLLSLSGGTSNPNLWNWNGEGGWAKGLAASAVTFGTLKFAGAIGMNENFLFQHAFQAGALVTSRQITGALGLVPKPQGGAGEQLLEAEVVNLQLSSGMALASRLAPGIFALGQGLDLSLAFTQRVTGHPPTLSPAEGPLQVAPALASLANDGLCPHTEAMEPSSKWKAGPLHMTGSRESSPPSTRTGPRSIKAPPSGGDSLGSGKEAERIKLVALGDIHSDWRSVQKILDYEFEDGSGTAISVGDLETYPSLSNQHQLHFIYGNHEDFPLVTKMRAGQVPSNQNYHPIFAGDLVRLGNLTIAGLPGNFSPKFWEKPRNAHPKYFLPSHFDKAKAIPTPIDIFLIHEAPKDVGFRKGGKDLGNPFLTGLIEYLKPRLVFFGHHHRRFEGSVGDTRIIGLDYPKRSYVVLDYDPKSDHLQLTEKVADPMDNDGKEFQFPWEQGKKEVVRRMFMGGFTVDKEKRIQELLETRYRESVIETMAKHLKAEVTGKDDADKAFRAETRAALAVNQSLPFVAKYVARLESNPSLSTEDKKNLLGEIFEEMTPDSLPTEISDDVRAFGEFLKALKIERTQ